MSNYGQSIKIKADLQINKNNKNTILIFIEN